MVTAMSMGITTTTGTAMIMADGGTREAEGHRVAAGVAAGAAPLPLHLLRLVSPSLPVGAFSYSRGLEAAVHKAYVHDAASAEAWILGTFTHAFASLDAPLFGRMMQALAAGDRAGFLRHDEWLRASRETDELQREDLQMGAALQRLLVDLEVPEAQALSAHELSYPGAFAIAAHHWQVPAEQALRGLLWAVIEGQVSAAIRLVPLGQTAGQRIMVRAVAAIEQAAERAAALADDDIGNMAMGLAMASAWHETQYSRLFRS